MWIQKSSCVVGMRNSSLLRPTSFVTSEKGGRSREGGVGREEEGRERREKGGGRREERGVRSEE